MRREKRGERHTHTHTHRDMSSVTFSVLQSASPPHAPSLLWTCRSLPITNGVQCRQGWGVKPITGAENSWGKRGTRGGGIGVGIEIGEGCAPGRGGEGGVRESGGRGGKNLERTRKRRGENEGQMEEGAEGEVSRRGNDSKVEGLLMSYISLWQHLYRLHGHGARARSLLLESPAGTPWEQEALVIVGGEQDREKEKGGRRGGGRREGIWTGPPGGLWPGLVGTPAAPSFWRAPGTLSSRWAGGGGQGLWVRVSAGYQQCGWPAPGGLRAAEPSQHLGSTLTQQMRRPLQSSGAGSVG